MSVLVKSANLLGRCMATGFVALIVVVVIGLSYPLSRSRPAERAFGARESMPISTPAMENGRTRAVAEIRKVWPKFPIARQRRGQEVEVAGIPCYAESWSTPAEPWEVTDFFRTRMVSEGWTDTTEEVFRLRPDDADGAQLQSPEFVERYNSIIDTRLVLSRGKQTFQIFANASVKSRFETTVAALLVESPSAVDFSDNVEAAFNDAPASPLEAKGVDLTETYNNTTYRTTMVQSPDAPRLAHGKVLAGLQKEGWRPAQLPAPRPAGAEDFSTLAKGRETAFVVTQRQRHGTGSAVSITRMSDQ